MRIRITKIAGIVVLGLLPSMAQAVPFTAGDLVVEQVGNGTAALTRPRGSRIRQRIQAGRHSRSIHPHAHLGEWLEPEPDRQWQRRLGRLPEPLDQRSICHGNWI